MSRYLVLAQDDERSTRELISAPESLVATLYRAVMDMGGWVDTAVVTSGRFGLAAIVELPSPASAIALAMLHQSLGRAIEVSPAVELADISSVLAELGKVQLGFAPTDPVDPATESPEPMRPADV